MNMKRMFIKILWEIVPKSLKKQLMNFKTLALDFGQWHSIKKGIAVDKDGNPIPWYVYPAIEYLKQFVLTDKTTFEWGSGSSSLFWAGKVKEIVSIESDENWFNIVNKRKSNNLKIFLLSENDYVRAILNQGKKFNIIIIDGEYRYECAKIAGKCLSPGGLIILDNSDWFPKTARTLREHNLIQVDFSGFGPVNNYTWTTSLFFSRNFDFKISQLAQPIGGVKQYGDE
jgi:hypothetical protein